MAIKFFTRLVLTGTAAAALAACQPGAGRPLALRKLSVKMIRPSGRKFTVKLAGIRP